MVEKAGKKPVDRRGFLLAAAAATVAAAATGTTAALINEKKQGGLANSSSADNPSAKAPTPPGEMATMRSEMAAIQAENERLQIRLAAAQGQLDLLSRTGQSNGHTGMEGWQTQLDEANSRVASLTGDVSLLSGLVALYEQLDAVDLGALANSGVNTVSSILAGIMEEMPGVAEGIQAGQDALEELEEQIPIIEEGHKWLQAQLEDLGEFYSAVEGALDNVVDIAGNFLQKLNQWFQDILRWLPFGFGDKANTTMGAIATLLDSVPNTIDGLQTQVSDPLALWLEKDGPTTRIQQRIISPVRHTALAKATLTVTQIQGLDGVYQSRLADPVKEAIEKQEAIREQIVAYRQANLV